MNREECEKAAEIISEYVFTNNEYTPSVYDAVNAIESIEQLIAEHFNYNQLKQNDLHDNAKIGDYVNGYRVEMVETLNGEPHYLIAYFDWGVQKPQSRWLPEHLVMSVVFAEDFEKVIKR